MAKIGAADANGVSTNLACGSGAIAGAEGENTALGSGTQAGGATADENTAVGEAAMAGIGANSDDNTALGEDSEAGIGDDSTDGLSATGVPGDWSVVITITAFDGEGSLTLDAVEIPDSGR